MSVEENNPSNKKLYAVILGAGLITVSIISFMYFNQDLQTYCYQVGEFWTFEGAYGENGFKQIWQYQEDCEVYQGDWKSLKTNADFFNKEK